MIQCALSGGMVNLDNEEEFVWCIEYFNETGKSLCVGLRLNFEIGNGIKSRFGISLDIELYIKIIEAEKKGFNGRVGTGDVLVFKNTGAYTCCFGNGFIQKPLDVVVDLSD